jgi:hypothetical protein
MIWPVGDALDNSITPPQSRVHKVFRKASYRPCISTIVTCIARKREPPLSEIGQLDRHLTLPHTLLEVLGCREFILPILLLLLPRCNMEIMIVVTSQAVTPSRGPVYTETDSEYIILRLKHPEN